MSSSQVFSLRERGAGATLRPVTTFRVFLLRPAGTVARFCVAGAAGLFLLSNNIQAEEKRELPAKAPANETKAEPGALPATRETKEWFAFAREVAQGLRTGDPRFALQRKTGGDGTSVYAKVLYNGEVVGAFLSENSSTSVEGEIASFNIARALGCGHLFQPAVAMELRGKGLAAFQKMIETAEADPVREANRQRILDEIGSDPAALHGVFKQWLPMQPLEYRSIELPDAPPNGALNEADPVARFLRADAPQPPAAELELPGLGGAHAPARGLARELSDILLVDALAGQWDRFSGNNLHLYVENGVARFAALDNGGASLANDHGYLAYFEKWVSRFDKPTVERLYKLDAFLQEPGAREFLGFRRTEDLAAALGIRAQNSWEGFTNRVKEVAAHVRRCEKSGGAFFSRD